LHWKSKPAVDSSNGYEKGCDFMSSAIVISADSERAEHPDRIQKMCMSQEAYAVGAVDLRPKLFRMAYLYLGSEALALDAVDDAIYQGLMSIKKLRQPEYFTTWLTRITINKCKDTLRRKKRELPFETIPEEAVEAFDSLSIKMAVSALPHELKEIIILRYFSGFTQAETAQMLDIPQGTVVTRQRRALRLLKLELAEEEIE